MPLEIDGSSWGLLSLEKKGPRGIRQKNLQNLDTILYQKSKKHNGPTLTVLTLSPARKPTDSSTSGICCRHIGGSYTSRFNPYRRETQISTQRERFEFLTPSRGSHSS
jgi:hypothetical protein